MPFCSKILLNVIPTNLFGFPFNCLELPKCEWSHYGRWSRCSVTCSSGFQTQTRKLISAESSSSIENKRCQEEEGSTQKRPCNKRPCPGILFSVSTYSQVSLDVNLGGCCNVKMEKTEYCRKEEK